MKAPSFVGLGLLILGGAVAVGVGAWPAHWTRAELFVGIALALWGTLSLAVIITGRSVVWAAALSAWVLVALARFDRPHELDWPDVALVGLAALVSAEAGHLRVRAERWRRAMGPGSTVPVGPVLRSLSTWSLVAVALTVGAWWGLQASVDRWAPPVVAASWERHGGLVLSAVFMLVAFGAWLVRSPWWIREPAPATEPAAEPALFLTRTEA